MRRMEDQGWDAAGKDIYQEGRSKRLHEGEASGSLWLQVSLDTADIEATFVRSSETTAPLLGPPCVSPGSAMALWDVTFSSFCASRMNPTSHHLFHVD